MWRAVLAAFAAFLIFPGHALAAETTITSVTDGDSGATLIDEDGNGSETTHVNFTVAPGSSAQASLDGGSWVSATEPRKTFYPRTGTHTVTVRAQDATGADPTPSTATFKVCARGETTDCGVSAISNPVSEPPPPSPPPPADTDGDGVPDSSDACPTVFGLGPDGCPVAPPPPPPTNGCQTGWFPVDGQSWWWQPSFGGDPEFQSRHLHVGGCIPRRELTLTGTVGFDIVVKMHNNPGRVYYVAIVVKTDSMEKAISVNPGWTCPVADCTFTRHFDISASEFDRAGLEEIRFRASDRQPDLGTELRASVNFQTHVENGKARDDVGRYPFLRGKGWYSGALYCEADYRDDLTPLPSSPVGDWTPQIRQVDHAAGDAPPTHHAARVDPNIHGGVRGTLLLDGPGQYQGPVSVPQQAPGAHKLMLKTDCAIPTGINTGVLVVPFSSP